MLSTLGRNFNLCFTKIKLTPAESPPSISQHHSRPSPTPTFIKTFNSLFDLTVPAAADSDSDSPTATPDFATAVASRRFFFSSPGRSNSIIDSSSPSLSSHSSVSVGIDIGRSEPDNVVSGGVAIQTYSPDPYIDFRRSMEEMVESRGLHVLDARESWDQLHELLTCYLALNPKCTHKFILAAFSDLLVSLMSTSDNSQSVNVI